MKPYLTPQQAATLSGYGLDDIQAALASGDLSGADPTGKGTRIPKASFEAWMAGTRIPPWDQGGWMICPLRLLGDIQTASGATWLEHDDILRLRLHGPLVEITVPRDHPAPIETPLMFDVTVGPVAIHVLVDVDQHVHQRHLLRGRQITWSGPGVDPKPGSWEGLRTFIAAAPRTGLPADVQAQVARLPATVTGHDVAKAFGIETPNAGHFREIADLLRGLGWSMKRTNKGWQYFAPTFVGRVYHTFLSETP